MIIRIKNTLLFLFFVSAVNIFAQSAPSSFERQAADASAARIFPVYSQHAVNIILFVGDGMGVTTVTAARIFDGQIKGNSGEGNVLFMETLDHMCMAKTYNIDAQCPDSAATMHAIMTGYKTKIGTMGYSKEVVRSDITSTKEGGGSAVKQKTMLEIFEEMGRATGVVSTAAITHATPAACYAKSINRSYQNDMILAANSAAVEAGAKDIARQLIEFPYGDGVDVAMGGGRYSFTPIGRKDRRDLTQEWLSQSNSAYVRSKHQFDEIDTENTNKLLGLFSNGHMKYEYDRTSSTEVVEPSISQMTVKAIRILRKNPKGFFLMVEGGRIDHAHHASNAYRAITDTIAFDDAIEAAVKELTPAERLQTLIIVTADHGHVFTIGGEAKRGNPILGLASNNDAFGQSYTIASYANGGGYTGTMVNYKTGEIKTGGQSWHHTLQGPLSYSANWEFLNFGLYRPDLKNIDVQSPSYIQEALVPRRSESHSIEDVPVYAVGSGAHMFRGTREQNYIFHVMNEAIKPVLSIDPGEGAENRSAIVKVNGFGSVQYKVQESRDLNTWSTINRIKGRAKVGQVEAEQKIFYRALRDVD